MKKIAIIEDDQHIGDILERTLTREGYGTLWAYSGTEALYLLSEHMLDLILLDLMLPRLSGEEILPWMQGIPVIVVSAKIGYKCQYKNAQKFQYKNVQFKVKLLC